MMDGQMKPAADYRFVKALVVGGVVGGVVGAGLTMLLAPRAAKEIRERAVGTAATFGDAVAERYRAARDRVADAVDGATRKGQGLRDGLCDTVARGAHDVELGAKDVQRYANDAKTHQAL